MKYRGENKINEALHEEIAGAKIAQLCPPPSPSHISSRSHLFTQRTDTQTDIKKITTSIGCLILYAFEDTLTAYIFELNLTKFRLYSKDDTEVW